MKTTFCIALFAVLSVAANPIGTAGVTERFTTTRSVHTPPELPVAWQSAGDSYSSGEGVYGNEGDCAQSRLAYGPAAADLLRANGWSVSSETFTACTGHLVEDMFNKRPDSGGKDSLWDWGRAQGGPPRVDVMSLSFGGNDIGFASLLTDCLVGKPDSWTDYLTTGIPGSLSGCDPAEADISKRIDWLLDPARRNCSGSRRTGEAGYDCDLNLGSRRGSIIDFYYDLVTQRLTRRGQLYVVGYPRLFAPVGEWPGWTQIQCQGVLRGDTEKLGRLADHLNDKLREAVKRANQALGADRVHYIDRLAIYRDGSHELCGAGDDWLNGISISRGGASVHYTNSFHPNAHGHAALAQALADQVELPSVPTATTAKTGPGEYTVEFNHPSWGHVRLVTRQASDDSVNPGPASITVYDASGATRYSYDFDSMYQLAPADIGAHPPGQPDMDAMDDTGNLFLSYNPGRYNGVIVLHPTSDGFEDLGTLPPHDSYTGRFYSGTLADKDQDGTYEIELSINDCEPSCADGTTTVTPYRWHGSDYVASPPPDDTHVTPDAMGPFRLGMARFDIGRLGFGLSQPGCGSQRTITGGDHKMEVAFDENANVTGLSTTDPAWTTDKGVHAGTALSDLRSAYGEALEETSFDGNVGPVRAWRLRSTDPSAAGRSLWFDTVDDTTVLSLTLVDGNDTPTIMLC